MSQLVSSGTVAIGVSGGTGAMAIGGSGELDLNLSGRTYGLTLRGGNVTFKQRLRVPDGKTLTLSTGAVASAAGEGVDILHGALKRDDTASDTIYFKFRVDPLSDFSDEEYYAGFQLFEGSEDRLGIGNAPQAWAYSAFYAAETGPSNKVTGDFDLHSSRPGLSGPGSTRPYELPRRGNDRTIVFRVRFVPNQFRDGLAKNGKVYQFESNTLQGHEDHRGEVLVVQKGTYLLGAIGFGKEETKIRLAEFMKNIK